MVNTKADEALIPIEKLAVMLSDAMSPVAKELQKLVKGFGGDPGTSGQYIIDFAGKVPREVKTKTGLF